MIIFTFCVSKNPHKLFLGSLLCSLACVVHMTIILSEIYIRLLMLNLLITGLLFSELDSISWLDFVSSFFYSFSDRAFNVGSYLARFCFASNPYPPFTVEWGVLYRCFGGCQGGLGGFYFFCFRIFGFTAFMLKWLFLIGVL